MWSLPEERPALMGILNVTPDSFSELGVNFNKSDAIIAAERMIEAGADIIDVGGESTRPGAAPVSVDDEIRRVAPVIESIAKLGVPISIDTRKAEVARIALGLGAAIVNDVSALGDPEMAMRCIEHGCYVCLMHMKGEPQTMQHSPTYEDVVQEVYDYLLARASFAEKCGIDQGKVWLDPGFGFGKTGQHNYRLLHAIPRFVASAFPILIGVSRKSFIGALSSAPVDKRLPGTLAAQVLAQATGAKIIRAHDVAEARQAIDVAATILKPSLFSTRPA